MASLYEMKIESLKGVGMKRAELFEKLDVHSVGDLLRYYPRDYTNWGNTVSIRDAVIGETAVIKATVLMPPSEQRIKGGKFIYKVAATDEDTDLHITFFNNRYIPNLLKEGETYLFRGKVGGTFFAKQMAAPEFILPGNAEAFIPVYHQTEGLSSRIIGKAVKEALKLLPETLNDPLPPELRAKYKLCHLGYAIENIHFPKSEQDLLTAKNRLIFEEFLVLQLGLIGLKKAEAKYNLHRIKNEFPKGFTELLSFELTNAQQRAIKEAVADMSSDSTMNRLLQGDVGSGKTAVAAALCYSVIKSGMQAAMMAPTEILANQHYDSLSELLEPAGIRVALLTGSVTQAKRRVLLQELEEGKIDLMVGTHALISDKVEYKNLGLVITDEQHRFGVKQRAALADKGSSPHLLVMSATPIPRTLALMVYGDLSVSILDELPPGRQKIETYLIDSGKRRRAFGYIQKHIDEGRQGYIICPLIDEGENDTASVNEYSKIVASVLPKVRVGTLHGRMKPAEKDAVMQSFKKGELDLLVSTTVVEVGVDVPNAVIMLIENAENYGLSQLHQLRGRIGRGKHKSTCILLTDLQNEETIARLKVMTTTSDGFAISDADLKLRGPGDFFGKRQHGLPEMKIGNMITDMNVLKEAQDCARELMSGGKIETYEYRRLRVQVKLLFERAGDNIFN